MLQMVTAAQMDAMHHCTPMVITMFFIPTLPCLLQSLQPAAETRRSGVVSAYSVTTYRMPQWPSASLILAPPSSDLIFAGAQTVGVRKDDDESAMEKLAGDHEENAADPEEIPDPEEIGEEIEVRNVGHPGLRKVTHTPVRGVCPQQVLFTNHDDCFRLQSKGRNGTDNREQGWT